MNTINKLTNLRLLALLLLAVTIPSCNNDDDAPGEENEAEAITDVTLIFTNDADPNDVIRASANDPDGLGVQELEVLDEITLDVNTTYTLTMEILNNLDPTDPEDIGEEVSEEDFEHQFFFSFSTGAFADPAGDGNIDNASDPLNYDDEDVNGNPVGLSTSWTTSGTTLTDGTFTARLQHQPDIKTSTTGANQGDTDFDLEFVLNIQ